MATRSLTLAEAVRALRALHGVPAGPPTADPFELVLWENVAYLARPERRREAFEDLRRTAGTTPRALCDASHANLARVAARGILVAEVVAKLRACADIAIERYGGDLGAVVQGPLDAAKRALRAFPGIGEPGAEKILLFAGRHPTLAPESNGLRVLVRLGLVREEKSYAKTYAASRAAAKGLAADVVVLQEAHLLLQQHGQSVCKHNAPRCDECPLAPRCMHAGGIEVQAGSRR